ncbi:DUF3052 family protein [Massilia sp. CF038]|uniref:DUF3052 family protein n=1 Tax=Massilia sp. CF038 TaxID=1881045 RepID=UPI0009211763|nr:DUF3052 family protein [Massilia sp. CF038]SHG38191.1 Protein of unknown function [Massilia sp. CF038]
MNDKTLADKMYLKTARSLAVINGAVHPAIVAQLPQELLIDENNDGAAGDADSVLLFALTHKQLEQFFPEAMRRLADKGTLWIAFMKATAPKATDLTRDSINAWTKERGATGVALISLDADWSALRLRQM